MFNEILTGKASLDPKSPPLIASPIGEPVVDQHRTCTTCGRPFVASASHHVKCGPCNVATIQQAQQESARNLAAAALRQQSDERTWTVLRWIFVALVGLGLAFYRYGMRKQMAEDNAVMHGHRPYSQ